MTGVLNWPYRNSSYITSTLAHFVRFSDHYRWNRYSLFFVRLGLCHSWGKLEQDYSVALAFMRSCVYTSPIICLSETHERGVSIKTSRNQDVKSRKVALKLLWQATKSSEHGEMKWYRAVNMWSNEHIVRINWIYIFWLWVKIPKKTNTETIWLWGWCTSGCQKSSKGIVL